MATQVMPAALDASRAAATRPRLLLVSYAFPPDRRVGALRWQRLAPAMVRAGWAVDVVSLDPSSIEQEYLDPAGLAELPAEVRTHGVPHPPLLVQRAQARLLAARRAVLARRGSRAGAAGSAEAPASSGDGGPTLRRSLPKRLAHEYFSVVDRAWHAAWARAAEASALAVAGRSRPSVIVSSGPPHSAHVAASRAAHRLGLPHVIDLRDPWTRGRRFDEELGGRLALSLEARDERRVLASARLVCCNTPSMEALLLAQYPELAGRTLLVMNGADDEPLPPTMHGERFLVVYAGAIYVDRDPTPLFQAAARVVRELGLTPAQFGIQLVGHVEEFQGTPVRELARRAGIEAYVDLLPPRPRRAVMELYAKAPMLVNLPQDSMTQIPAKTFEYVRFASWVLVFTPPGSATDQLLAGSGADVVGLCDVDATAQVLRSRYEQFRAGTRPTPINADGRFSRSTQAARLVGALNCIVDRSDASQREG